MQALPIHHPHAHPLQKWANISGAAMTHLGWTAMAHLGWTAMTDLGWTAMTDLAESYEL